MVTTVGGDDGHAIKPKEKTVHAVAKKPAKVRKNNTNNNRTFHE